MQHYWEYDMFPDDDELTYDDYNTARKVVQIGGNHYVKAIQPWDAMQSWMTSMEFKGFLRGNVIKYVARYKEKNGVEDLEKAMHYLDKLIQEEERE
jgi:3-dehydroquinate dehydratase